MIRTISPSSYASLTDHQLILVLSVSFDSLREATLAPCVNRSMCFHTCTALSIGLTFDVDVNRSMCFHTCTALSIGLTFDVDVNRSSAACQRGGIQGCARPNAIDRQWAHYSSAILGISPTPTCAVSMAAPLHGFFSPSQRQLRWAAKKGSPF